jgi:hypothetical protein
LTPRIGHSQRVTVHLTGVDATNTGLSAELIHSRYQGGSAALRRPRRALALGAPRARARQLDSPSRLIGVAHPRFRLSGVDRNPSTALRVACGDGLRPLPTEPGRESPVLAAVGEARGVVASWRAHRVAAAHLWPGGAKEISFSTWGGRGSLFGRMTVCAGLAMAAIIAASSCGSVGQNVACAGQCAPPYELEVDFQQGTTATAAQEILRSCTDHNPVVIRIGALHEATCAAGPPPGRRPDAPAPFN